MIEYGIAHENVRKMLSKRDSAVTTNKDDDVLLAANQSVLKIKLQSSAKILETWYFLPPSPLKQCCNNDSMPPGLLKWSTQHCLWGEGGNDQ